MDNWDYTLPWYHGSQQELTTLCIGSSITQDRDIARIFGHRPGVSSIEDDGRIKHNGTACCYLHIVDEPIHADDVEPHPHPVNASKWEWLVRREVKVRLLECPPIRDEERLTEADIAQLWERQKAVWGESDQLESFRTDC